MISLETAGSFLALLDGSDQFTFQTFADDPTRPLASWPTVLHGSFDEHSGQLASLNDAGAGIFVMVNAGDGLTRASSKTCRTAANVVRVRALFVDLDGAPIEPVLTTALPPDWVVQSSPGRWHAYWIVHDCPLADFARAQGALAARFNGDRTVKDLPRVMRVPGFVHRKREPFLSELFLSMDFDQILRGRHG